MHTANVKKKKKNRRKHLLSRCLVLDNFHFLMFIFFSSVVAASLFVTSIVCVYLFVAIAFLFFGFSFASSRSGNKCYYPLLPNISTCRFWFCWETQLLLLIIFRFCSSFLEIVSILVFFLRSYACIRSLHLLFLFSLLFHSVWIILAVSCWCCQTYWNIMSCYEWTRSPTQCACIHVFHFTLYWLCYAIVVVVSIKFLCLEAFHFVWSFVRSAGRWGICTLSNWIRSDIQPNISASGVVLSHHFTSVA